MVMLTFTSASGGITRLDAQPGTSVMEAATAAGIDGILGDCGGHLSCATCHCIVDEAWAARLAPPCEQEEVMLDGVLDRQPTSRLSCQLQVTEALDGIVLRLPEAQF